MNTVNPIGFPSRALDLDVYPGFLNPPQGYGEVAFYWWIGEKLTKERLLWQLEQLKDHHITGLQINYAHSDEGGDSYGYSFPSDPPLFSEAWWELFSCSIQLPNNVLSVVAYKINQNELEPITAIDLSNNQQDDHLNVLLPKGN